MKFLYTIAMLLLSTSAYGSVTCQHTNGNGRSSTATWATFVSPEQAIAATKSQLSLLSLRRLDNYRSTQELRSTVLFCADSIGKTVLYTEYRFRPMCEIGKFAGGWDCDKYHIVEVDWLNKLNIQGKVK